MFQSDLWYRRYPTLQPQSTIPCTAENKARTIRSSSSRFISGKSCASGPQSDQRPRAVPADTIQVRCHRLTFPDQKARARECMICREMQISMGHDHKLGVWGLIRRLCDPRRHKCPQTPKGAGVDRHNQCVEIIKDVVDRAQRTSPPPAQGAAP